MSSPARRLADAVRALLRGLRGVLGEDAYERYLAHCEREHPGGSRMSAREFWRDRADQQDRSPGARCC